MDLSRFVAGSKPPIDLDDLKRRNPLVETVDKYGVKRDRHGNALCPFHNEKTPSFGVDKDKGWHCFGCGRGGDVIAFVQEYEGVDFHEACERLLGGSTDPAKQIRIRTPEELEQERARKEEADHREKWKRECAQEDWRNHIPLWDPGAALGVRYLRDTRGIHPPYPETVGFGSYRHPVTGLTLPALILARHNPADHDHIAGVQYIFLGEDAQKIPDKAKISLGRIEGGRSRLLNPYPLTHLLLGEGLETSLSAHRIFGGDDVGAWCFCGGFPGEVVLPDSVTEALIVADADEHGESERKAEALAEWIRSTGRSAQVLVPGAIGLDANDILRGRHHGRL
jgi:DNA primase